MDKAAGSIPAVPKRKAKNIILHGDGFHLLPLG
jgi:hypothetical protein